jgi:hypothetical protein
VGLLVFGTLLLTNLAPLVDHHNGAKTNHSDNGSREQNLILTTHGDEPLVRGLIASLGAGQSSQGVNAE